jgi:acetoin:2,6-dichlorophenolindophenol oxidoreductase subunit beta
MPDGATATAATTRTLTYIQAVNEALRWGLDHYPEALLFGEDVGLPGGPYGASRGLHDTFGDRVFDTPISETAMLGAGVGAAMRGMRPIIEIMYADFFLVALDQVVNQAANVRYASRGRYTCPLTIRSQQAATPGACAQHTQSLEAFFAHVPGLRVGLPADARDAYEMLRAAIAENDPVVVLESRALYPRKQELELDGPVEPVGGTRVRRPGDDVTVVTWGRMVHEALDAADRLAAEDIGAEVIDLRWLSPLDLGPVRESIARTGRVVVAHEANRTGGFGAEIAARIADEAFWDLDGPVARVAGPDVPLPAAPVLQEALLPQADAIAACVRGLLGVQAQ